MNTTCESIRDQLPDLAAGRLAPGEGAAAESHLEGCADCQEEFRMLALLAQAPPPVPGDLEAKIRGAAAGGVSPVAAPGRGRRWFGPTWGLAAAAVMALLLGRTLVDTGDDGSGELLLAGGDLPVLLEDDGVVAGAPMLDGLSEEDLLALLDEMDG